MTFYLLLILLGAENCGKRRKRRDADGEESIILPEDGQNAIYDYTPDQNAGSIPNWPTKSGIKETTARSECDKALKNSETGKVCLQTVKGFSISDLVDQCVLDVQVNCDTFLTS